MTLYSSPGTLAKGETSVDMISPLSLLLLPLDVPTPIWLFRIAESRAFSQAASLSPPLTRLFDSDAIPDTLASQYRCIASKGVISVALPMAVDQDEGGALCLDWAAMGTSGIRYQVDRKFHSGVSMQECASLELSEIMVIPHTPLSTIISSRSPAHSNQ